MRHLRVSVSQGMVTSEVRSIPGHQSRQVVQASSLGFGAAQARFLSDLIHVLIGHTLLLIIQLALRVLVQIRDQGRQVLTISPGDARVEEVMGGTTLDDFQ